MTPAKLDLEELRFVFSDMLGTEKFGEIRGDLLLALIDEVEHLRSRFIHTCHDDCQQKICVDRRRLKSAEEALGACKTAIDLVGAGHLKSEYDIDFEAAFDQSRAHFEKFGGGASE